MELSLVRGDSKPAQIRSYVEKDLKRAVEDFAAEQKMTSSQGMRRLLISGLEQEGWNVVEIDPAELSVEEKQRIARSA